MLNQLLRRLQEVRGKLARHALLLNPMQSRLAPQSEILWLRLTERSAVLFEIVRSPAQPFSAGINRSDTRLQSLQRGFAPFYFGRTNRKVT
jgi:hypothetical protein